MRPPRVTRRPADLKVSDEILLEDDAWATVVSVRGISEKEWHNMARVYFGRPVELILARGGDQQPMISDDREVFERRDPSTLKHTGPSNEGNRNGRQSKCGDPHRGR